MQESPRRPVKRGPDSAGWECLFPTCSNVKHDNPRPFPRADGKPLSPSLYPSLLFTDCLISPPLPPSFRTGTFWRFTCGAMLPFKCPRIFGSSVSFLFKFKPIPLEEQRGAPTLLVPLGECDSSSHSLPGPSSQQRRLQTMPPAQRTREGRPQGQAVC